MSEFEEKHRRSGLSDTDIAETVGHLVEEAEQRQRESETDGRGRAGRSGKLGIDSRGRAKASYDLPVSRQTLVREMAETEDVAQSDVVEAAIVVLYNAWQAGQLDFHDLKTHARSLHVAWKLQVPDDLAISH